MSEVFCFRLTLNSEHPQLCLWWHTDLKKTQFSFSGSGKYQLSKLGDVPRRSCHVGKGSAFTMRLVIANLKVLLSSWQSRKVTNTLHERVVSTETANAWTLKILSKTLSSKAEIFITISSPATQVVISRAYRLIPEAQFEAEMNQTYLQRPSG